MAESKRIRPTHSVLPPRPPLLTPHPSVPPLIPPGHVVDLMTEEAKLVECPALSDSRPEFKTTYDVEPHAEDRGYDDSDWEAVPATDLGGRRGGGMISFLWYRATLTIPVNAAGYETAGAMAVFRVNVDDYAEIWINGEMPRAAGRPSPYTIQGFNMPHRIVLATEVAPGDAFEVAVFAINGPISAAPANFLWFREAKVEFFR
jgi:hypothetical protein